ncbi:hypothetical protein ACLB1Q_23365 [Escherichia coli]
MLAEFAQKEGIGEWPYWDCRGAGGCGTDKPSPPHQPWSLQMLGEMSWRSCLPYNLLRLSFNSSILPTVRAGPELCWMATLARRAPGCATP